MARYALVKGGVVATIVESGSQPTVDLGGLWVLCTNEVGAGFVYDSGSFEPPVVPRHLTTLEFLRRLTMAEEAAIDMASLDHPSDAPEQRMQQATLRAAMRRLMAAEFIDLDDVELVALTTMLESLGLLATGRAAEILG